MGSSFSPDRFGALVNASVNAINEATLNTAQPKKMTFDKDDSDSSGIATDMKESDDFDDLEDLDDLDDLDDIDDLNDLEESGTLEDLDDIDDTGTSEPQQTNTESIDDPLAIPFKTLDQDSSSKIPDYSMSITVARDHGTERKVFENLFDEFKSKFETSFLVTNDCNSFLDLWNKNFIAFQTQSEVEAFDRLVAMFYHINCSNLTVAQKLLELNSTSVIEKLSQLCRDITVADVENPDQAAAQVEQMQTNEQTEVPNVTSDSITESASKAIEIQTKKSVDEVSEVKASTSPDKLSKKKKLQLFAEMALHQLASEDKLSQVNSIPTLLNGINALSGLLQHGILDKIEYVKFLLFMLNTREIVLDIELVEKTKKFNTYVQALICTKLHLQYNLNDFDDSFMLVNKNNGKITILPLYYLLLNWRTICASFTNKALARDIPFNGMHFLLVTPDSSVKMTNVQLRNLKSNLTLFAESFVSTADAYFNLTGSFENFRVNYTSNDIDNIRFILKQRNIPSAYKLMTSCQKAIVDMVLAYADKYQSFLVPFFYSSQITNLHAIRLSILVQDDVMAIYQIMASLMHCLNPSIKIHLVKANAEFASFRLAGDGIPNSNLSLTTGDFLKQFTIVMGHAQLSSETFVTIEDGTMIITFKK